MTSRSSLKTKKIQQPIDTSKYDSYNLTELRKLREEEVNNLNFEEVNVIDEAIRKCNTSNKDTVVEAIKKSLSEIIDDCFKRYEQNCQAIENDSAAKEAVIRRASNDYFQQVKERHIQDHADLETSRQLNLIRAAERPSAKNYEMKNIAKNLARSGVIDAAISAREEAKMSLEQEIILRKYDINARFEKALENLTRKQVHDLVTMQNNLSKQLQSNEKSKEKEITLLKQALKGSITNAMRRAISEGCNKLSKKDERPDLTAQITNFVQQKLEDENRVSVFQGLE
ncbi:hypothetical protein M9Y10_002488 [Tritrichomonas musculus]|uniref:Uncharacterized protein n=1 Tax=Tritrichomonas musculus TaxID=1915356 RepID=A0ABR2L9Y5_9EUKA